MSRSVATGVGFLIGKRLLKFWLEKPVARLREFDALIPEAESTLFESGTGIGNELCEEPAPLPVGLLSMDVLYGDNSVTGRLDNVEIELLAIDAPSSGNPLNKDVS